jgi:hypothetical protein
MPAQSALSGNSLIVSENLTPSAYPGENWREHVLQKRPGISRLRNAVRNRHRRCIHQAPEMEARNQVIEVTTATVLQIGGCRFRIEPIASDEPARTMPPNLTARSGDSTPTEWRIAEAELQRKTNMPFEPPSAAKAERIALWPRVGGKYHATSGLDIEIARVVGRDGSLWFVIDVKDRPVALRRNGLAWFALPRDPTSPARGDAIIHQGTTSWVGDVLGEAEVGGWAVTNASGVPLHVLRSEEGRWMSLGAVEVKSQASGEQAGSD